jgi:uncharacterized protein with ParB-like and HNH nuclease domain
MSFEKTTIKEVVEEIHSKRYLLPAIQREFVWKESQIELLFDSIMSDYPISSFLFWKLKPENASAFTFYEFLRHYHERDARHNTKANLAINRGDIVAVLDGQQRLASFYIALMGSYASRVKGGWWSQDSNFPRKQLYLNLQVTLSGNGMQYYFQFLNEDEAKIRDENNYWFKVADILKFKSLYEINEYIYANGLNTEKLPSTLLFKLFESIHNKEIVNFYLEKSESLDKVLNIFIRINSGGTKLSYSDMLLSIATAQWDKKDAREEINGLVDELHRREFWGISKDWVLKACLYLADINDIKFKVDNFSRDNMLKVEENWDEIRSSLVKTVELFVALGYSTSRGNIATYNALLPIAYYLHHFQKASNFSVASQWDGKRREIRHWFVMVSLRQIFSSKVDTMLSVFRNNIRKNQDFTFAEQRRITRYTGNFLSFSEEEVDAVLEYKYGEKYTFNVLSLLYPTLEAVLEF